MTPRSAAHAEPDPPHPNIWYPFTPVGGMRRPEKVVSGRGAELRLEDGRVLLDCISSWWVNLHGHGHPAVASAIADQARRLEHVVFAGFTHDPAERVAEALASMLPGSLSRVFFSDDGSTAVEVALKIATQYWRNAGERRSTFLAFEGAYHGDTFGAMSVGARGPWSSAFEDQLFGVERIPFPETWIGDAEVEIREQAVIDAVARRLTRGSPIAAVVVEPLIQGAGGMRMCRPEFLRALRRVTTEHGTLLVFDEVMTGFGRTGELFAADRAGVAPDLICLAKGITGGFLPMAVTVASDEVFETFVSREADRTLWHGHSYTANPLGCAAAIASLELLAEGRFRTFEADHIAFVRTLDPSRVERPRVSGTVMAFDVRTGHGGYFDEVSARIKETALEQGLLLRPLGNTIYLMPPYCLVPDERARIYDGIRAVVDQVTS
jgi:adenosylmethionine---8-amino-7-oxononanoate aminotransferase